MALPKWQQCLVVLMFVAACSDGGGSVSANDGGAIGPPSNTPPEVSAGDDQTVTEASVVILTGTVTDPDDTPTLLWTQVSGPDVTLQDADTLSAQFTSPSVITSETLVFRLTATDSANPPVSDDVTVTVEDSGVIISELTPPFTSYIDPEIHPLERELVFQSNGEGFVVPYDPATGQLVGGAVPEAFDDVGTLTDTKNGPEYGQDDQGVAIYYNKEASDGSIQIFRARRNGLGAFMVSQVSLNGDDRINQLPSQNEDATTTWLVYARSDATAPFGGGYIAYADANDPSSEIDITPVRPGYSGFRWVKGTSIFLTTIAEGTNEGQVLMVNAETGQQTMITNDPGIKFDPFGWFPPEFEGDMAFSATTGAGGDISIYRESGGQFFDLYSEQPPASASLPFAQSPEPFVAQDGTSYISLTLADVADEIFADSLDADIWVYGIEDGADRFTLRCSDDEPMKVRHEAEMVSGDTQTFVYYNSIDDLGIFELTLCETGLAP